jgi:WD40 repeat protein
MAPPGRDPADWLLALAMRSLPPARRAWGQAMHAELASIDRGTDRWRFALGCVRVAVWQGPFWRVAGCLVLQGAALALALSSSIGGLFRTEVIGLVLIVPPVLWWIGGTARGFPLGPTRSARVGRRAGYGLVAVCVVVAVGFIAAEIEHRPDGYGVSAFWLGVVLLALAVHTRDILGVTSARSTVSPAAMTSGAGFGAGAGLAAYALLPFSQSLDVHGAWLAAAYPAALALALVGAPAVAGIRAARASRSVRPGLHAGGCAGLVAALVLFIVGVGSVWLRPELVDSSIFDKGPEWLPAETREVAGTYVIALVFVPLLGLLFGALGATIGAASTAAPVGGRRWVNRLLAGFALAGLAAACALCYPLTHVFDGRDTTSFGVVGTTDVAFSADGRALVTANGYQTAILWNLADPARPSRSATFFGAAAFAPDGRTLATRGLLWDVADPAQPARIAAFDDGDPAVFSADGRSVASENNGVGMLWDVADRAHPRRTGTFTGAADAFSRDGRTFATTDSCTSDRAGFEVGCATTLWSLTDRARSSRTAVVSGANAVFSPDGHALATRAAHDTVLLWSLADPRHPRRIATLVCGADDRSPAAVVFSPDGRSLATGSEDGTVRLRQVADPTRFATLPPARSRPNSGQIGVSSTHTVVAFSPDGRTLTAIMGNNLVTRWNVADPRRPTRTAVLTRETQGAGVVAFSRDATTVAGAAVDGANRVSLWRIGTR